MPAPVPPPPVRRCRVVVVDDHAAIVEMLCEVIDAMDGFRVVGRAEESTAAVAVCERERPDLVVLDLSLRPMSGIAVLSQLRRGGGGPRILVFSGYLHSSSIRRAMKLGADGLVEKTASLEELREGLRAVSAGRVFFSRAVSATVHAMVSCGASALAADIALSERETAVLKALAEGLSSKEIAARLGLSVHTVVGLRMRLMEKTGRRGVAQLSRYAAELGLVDSEGLPLDLSRP